MPYRGGYGFIRSGGKREPILYAHRVSYELAYGPIPKGKLVCHHCDTPLCVRPSHLFLGTRNDNVQDAIRKGRHAHGERAGAKLTEAEVLEILASSARPVDLAHRYGVSARHVRKIRAGTTWRHVAR